MEFATQPAPVIVVYAVLCILLNLGINLLNVAWRESHQIRQSQAPDPVARWMKDSPGVQVFRGAAGHPFTPWTVIVGVLLTLLATYALLRGTSATPEQTIFVAFGLFAIGGAIMAFGDLARYLRYG